MTTKVRRPAQANGDTATRLFTAPEVASYLRVRVKRVYELVGHIAIRCGDRTLRWDPTDLKAWLDSCRRERGNDAGQSGD